jgi:gamma-glutamyl-gamma-aminobutyrate hydrolase PuuD
VNGASGPACESIVRARGCTASEPYRRPKRSGILTVVVTSRSRPLIGLTAYRQTTSWWSWEADAALVPGSYLDVVEAAGGRPVILPPSGASRPVGEGQGQTGATSGPPDGLDRLLAAVDGLVLTGGGDLDAARYGQRADPHTAGTNEERDELELGLLGAALAADLPVLAVCRGLQVLNVALGGDLVQHLPEPSGSAHRPRPGAFGTVRVTTEPSSTLRWLFGESADVQCSHHQAIATVAPGLRVTARSADGVIEAVELPGHRFVVGVQWHPEEDGDTRLFEALVASAHSALPRPMAPVHTRS